MINPKVKIIYKLILICVVLLAIYFGKVVFFPKSIPNGSYQLVIGRDESLSMVADNLNKAGIIDHPRIFLRILRLLHKDKKVAAGLYILKEPMSIWHLIKRLTNGKPDQISVTILDGWTFAELRDYLNKLPDIQHLSKNLTNSDIKNVLKVSYPSLEGIFYPDTYFIAPNQSDFEIMQIAYKAMQQKLADIYNKRNLNSVYTNPYQLLIMASLIDKETNNPQDMILISTVFNNRIRKGMKLQDDPAVFFGLNDKGVVTRADFQIDTAYNTYLHSGLPPTPICIPSYAALLAASKPMQQQDLYYFVAIGNGRTRFSKTFAQHQSAVDKYLHHKKSKRGIR